MHPTDTSRCPLCGQANTCAIAAGLRAEDCWCMTQRVSPAALARVPAEARGRACLCPRCAADMISTPSFTQEPPCPPTTSK